MLFYFIHINTNLLKKLYPYYVLIIGMQQSILCIIHYNTQYGKEHCELTWYVANAFQHLYNSQMT